MPLLMLPIAVPLGAGILSLLAWRYTFLQRILGIVGASGLLAAGLWLVDMTREGEILVVQVGSWPAPYGITLVADLFSALMVAVTGLMGLLIVVYSLGTVDREREAFGYHALVQLLLAGVSGAFLTGDIFNMFVWFEVFLIASFVLLALGGGREQLEGSIKYLVLNLLSSAIFLTATGILYGIAGTLNLAHLSVVLADADPRLVLAVAMFYFIAYGIKAAVFPLFFWLPASYHTPPVAVSAIFAALLTKVGVYALIRVFTLLFVQDVEYTHHMVMLPVAGFTMLVGVLGALAQNDFRRVIGFHIVSQIGYMIMGLALFTPLALAAGIFYIVHNIVAKTNLFLISGIVLRLRGTLELKPIGGIYRTRPLLAILFLFSALSLAGIPPLSGFVGKLALIQAGLGVQAWSITAVALFVSICTLMSMLKIWNEAFWKDAPENSPPEAPHVHPTFAGRFALVAPVVVLAAATLLLGLGAETFLGLTARAADQLLERDPYIRAVLGPGGLP